MTYDNLTLLLTLMENNQENLDIQSTQKTEIVDYLSEQQKQRDVVLQSIATHGLISEKSAYELNGSSRLASGDQVDDRNKSANVYGALVISSRDPHLEAHDTEIIYHTKNLKGNPLAVEISTRRGSDQDVDKLVLNSALYEGPFSVFPVVGERQRDGLEPIIDRDPQEFQNRLQNSILCISTTELVGPHMIHASEVMTYQDIPSDKFLFVLAPEHLYEEVNTKFEKTGKTRVVSVKNVDHQFFGDKTIPVPDYESFIKNLRDVSSEPLFIHGVRLPTISDISTQYK